MDKQGKKQSRTSLQTATAGVDTFVSGEHLVCGFAHVIKTSLIYLGSRPQSGNRSAKGSPVREVCRRHQS